MLRISVDTGNVAGDVELKRYSLRQQCRFDSGDRIAQRFEHVHVPGLEAKGTADDTRHVE